MKRRFKVDGKVTLTANGAPVGLLSAFLSTSGMSTDELLKATKLDKRTVSGIIAGDTCRASTAKLIGDNTGLLMPELIAHGVRRRLWTLNYQPDGNVEVCDETEQS